MKIDLKFIGYINTSENITGAQVKDCFVNKNNQLVFIVKQGQGSMAVGKKAIKIRKLENLLHRKIKLIEFNENPVEFVKNMICPLKSPEIVLNENELIIKTDTMHLKALLLGRDKANLNELQIIVTKYFNNIKIKIE